MLFQSTHFIQSQLKGIKSTRDSKKVSFHIIYFLNETTHTVCSCNSVPTSKHCLHDPFQHDKLIKTVVQQINLSTYSQLINFCSFK